MLRQYAEIKAKHPDDFLFFRLGDFYELFDQDAKMASKILGLTLTARHRGTPHEIAMCGVPYHSADRYVAELLKSGKRVAICEQVSDPKLPGIVERKVIKVITAGTVLDETVTDPARNNFLVALCWNQKTIGLGSLDMGTGEFQVLEVSDQKTLKSFLFLLSPAEILLPPSMTSHEIASDLNPSILCEYELPYFENPEQYLQRHFQVATLEGFGIGHLSQGLRAAATVLAYAKENQKTYLAHVKKISLMKSSETMMLDEATVRNLELLTTSREGRSDDSLLSVMDRTLTRMGIRLLRQWLLSPLIEIVPIENRLDAVDELVTEHSMREQLQRELKDFSDLQRLTGKIGCQACNARDLFVLGVQIRKIPLFQNILQNAKSQLLKEISAGLHDLPELSHLLEKRILPDPSPTLLDGNMIREGWHPELDRLKKIIQEGSSWLLKYQRELREQTRITTLKVKFNKVFGYSIELTKAQSEKVPDFFQLKQTLVSTNRYITPELKQFEKDYLQADEKIKHLEYTLFQETVEAVIPFLEKLQTNALLIAKLDVLQCFAQIAVEQHYCRPNIHDKQQIHILGGRHPVIESRLQHENKVYIENDVLLDQDHQELIILTGPNMSGKSSYLRQTAIIVLMAQMGSFVPAKIAEIGIRDRIFTRVGASDDLTLGRSTFMVEMIEAASILHQATDRSLIVFDELGRGTSTYDGVSIAWAVLEYVAREIKALTLFATHYHELMDCVKEIPQSKNFSVAVTEQNGEVIFLRKIVEGGVNRSYGIEVAKLAGMPQKILVRAKKILAELEEKRTQEEQLFLSFESQQISPQRSIDQHLKTIDLNALTPLQAFQLLSEWKKDL